MGTVHCLYVTIGDVREWTQTVIDCEEGGEPREKWCHSNARDQTIPLERHGPERKSERSLAVWGKNI